MGFQSYITAAKLGIFNYFNFSSPETTILQSPSERSTSPSNAPPLKQHIPQVPSRRPFHRNELACINIQKITRGYLTRRKLAAIDWTNDQLKDPSLTNTFFENEDHRKPTLLFKIAKKEIVIPNELSLNHVMKHLIQDKEDLNTRDEDGNTPLHLASKVGHLEMVKFLIDSGVDLNAKGLLDNTPLHLAIIIDYGNPEIAKVLIENGADLNTIGDCNNTPFHMALIKGDLDLAKLLNITDHLDRYDSIDSLSFEFEGLTVDQKDFYSEHQQQIESLMDKRAENLLKKAITELNKDISLATIKRGKSFLESYGQVPNLTALSAIVIQNNIKKYENDPDFNFLKEDALNQKSLYTSYPTFEQINHARYLLNCIKK